MPARAIASGVVSFGLVSIPVKLYSTSESSASISFNLLHAKCKGRLKQQYICPTDENQVVPRDEIVKGYEFAKNQYVTFTNEELAAIEEASTGSIEITEFVPAALVDPVFLDKTYYLGPDKGGDRPYKLLAEVMRRSGRSALAKYAARGKQYLVMVTARPEGLILQQLHHADEVKPFAEVPIGEAAVKDSELERRGPARRSDLERRVPPRALSRRGQGPRPGARPEEESRVARSSSRRPRRPRRRSSTSWRRSRRACGSDRPRR